MRTGALLLALLAGATACGGGGADEETLRVFAAASLSEALGAIAETFEASHHGVEVELHLAGTATLVRQLEQGAPGDVFASADETSMNAVVSLGITSGQPRTFAANALEIVVERGNPQRVEGLEDLAREELVIALAAEDVPAGRYARQALRAAGVEARPDTLEPSVKAIVSKVGLGEVDAGVVYRTDVLAAGAEVSGVEVAPAHNVRAVLPIVALADGGGAADDFVAFVLSDEARAVLAAHGFGPGDGGDRGDA